MKSVTFRAAALRDIEEAFEWYEYLRAGLGEELLDEIRVAVSLVVEHPRAYPVLRPQTRRALLKKFPYGLFYQIHGDQITVLACMHTRRSPRRWYSRS